MKLIWHGHACFELRLSSGSAVFDPYCPGSVPGMSLPELNADAVICSHGHSDHNCSEAVKLSGRKPEFKVTQIPVFHDDQCGKLRGKNLCSIVEADGLRIAHLGDLGHPLSGDELRSFGRLDLLMIPVGGVYTINYQGARDLANMLGPKVVIPMHYRTDAVQVELDDVTPFLDHASGCAIHRMRQSEASITPESLGSDRIIVLDYRA